MIATTDAGAVATHRLRLILGGKLTQRLARRAMATMDFAIEGTSAGPTRWHRFGPRRLNFKISKRVIDEPSRGHCATLVALRLTASGLLRARFYSCPKQSQPVFRRHPRWRGKVLWVEIPSRR